MLIKNKTNTKFLGKEGPIVLYFRTTLHAPAPTRTDIRSLGPHKNLSLENSPTLGFDTLLCIISQEKHKNKLPYEVKEWVKLYGVLPL